MHYRNVDIDVRHVHVKVCKWHNLQHIINDYVYDLQFELHSRNLYWIVYKVNKVDLFCIPHSCKVASSANKSKPPKWSRIPSTFSPFDSSCCFRYSMVSLGKTRTQRVCPCVILTNTSISDSEIGYFILNYMKNVCIRWHFKYKWQLIHHIWIM